MKYTVNTSKGPVSFSSVGEPIIGIPATSPADPPKREKVPGSGRKAKGAAGRTISFPTCVSPTVADYLATMGATRGEQVENAVREMVRLRWVFDGTPRPEGFMVE